MCFYFLQEESALFKNKIIIPGSTYSRIFARAANETSGILFHVQIVLFASRACRVAVTFCYLSSSVSRLFTRALTKWNTVRRAAALLREPRQKGSYALYFDPSPISYGKRSSNKDVSFEDRLVREKRNKTRKPVVRIRAGNCNIEIFSTHGRSSDIANDRKQNQGW